MAEQDLLPELGGAETEGVDDLMPELSGAPQATPTPTPTPLPVPTPPEEDEPVEYEVGEYIDSGIPEKRGEDGWLRNGLYDLYQKGSEALGRPLEVAGEGLSAAAQLGRGVLSAGEGFVKGAATGVSRAIESGEADPALIFGAAREGAEAELVEDLELHPEDAKAFADGLGRMTGEVGVFVLSGGVATSLLRGLSKSAKVAKQVDRLTRFGGKVLRSDQVIKPLSKAAAAAEKIKIGKVLGFAEKGAEGVAKGTLNPRLEMMIDAGVVGVEKTKKIVDKVGQSALFQKGTEKGARALKGASKFVVESTAFNSAGHMGIAGKELIAGYTEEPVDHEPSTLLDKVSRDVWLDSQFNLGMRVTLGTTSFAWGKLASYAGTKAKFLSHILDDHKNFMRAVTQSPGRFETTRSYDDVVKAHQEMQRYMAEAYAGGFGLEPLIFLNEAIGKSKTNFANVMDKIVEIAQRELSASQRTVQHSVSKVAGGSLNVISLQDILEGMNNHITRLTPHQPYFPSAVRKEMEEHVMALVKNNLAARDRKAASAGMALLEATGNKISPQRRARASGAGASPLAEEFEKHYRALTGFTIVDATGAKIKPFQDLTILDIVEAGIGDQIDNVISSYGHDVEEAIYRLETRHPLSIDLNTFGLQSTAPKALTPEEAKRLTELKQMRIRNAEQVYAVRRAVPHVSMIIEDMRKNPSISLLEARSFARSIRPKTSVSKDKFSHEANDIAAAYGAAEMAVHDAIEKSLLKASHLSDHKRAEIVKTLEDLGMRVNDRPEVMTTAEKITDEMMINQMASIKQLDMNLLLDAYRNMKHHYAFLSIVGKSLNNVEASHLFEEAGGGIGARLGAMTTATGQPGGSLLVRRTDASKRLQRLKRAFASDLESGYSHAVAAVYGGLSHAGSFAGWVTRAPTKIFSSAPRTATFRQMFPVAANELDKRWSTLPTLGMEAMGGSVDAMMGLGRLGIQATTWPLQGLKHVADNAPSLQSRPAGGFEGAGFGGGEANPLVAHLDTLWSRMRDAPQEQQEEVTGMLMEHPIFNVIFEPMIPVDGLLNGMKTVTSDGKILSSREKAQLRDRLMKVRGSNQKRKDLFKASISGELGPKPAPAPAPTPAAERNAPTTLEKVVDNTRRANGAFNKMTLVERKLAAKQYPH